MPSSDYTTPTNCMSLKLPAGLNRIRNWTVTPNYRSTPKDQLPINPYSDTKISYKQNLWEGQFATRKVDGLVRIDYPAGYLYLGSELWNEFNLFRMNTDFYSRADSTDNADQVKLLNKAADAKVNFTVSWVEAHKTYQMLEDAVVRVSKAMRALRRGRFSEVATLLNLRPGTVHKTWLEYKYGWTPYLMEVKGAAELFAQHILRRNACFTVTTRSSFSASWVKETVYTPYGGSGTASYTQLLEAKYECTHKLWLEVTNPAVSAAQQMGLTNPALLAWEVIPYSFVFDWFMSVGDWLTAITALDGLRIVKGMRSNTNEFQYSWMQSSTSTEDPYWTYHSGGRNKSLYCREYARNSYAPDPLQLSIPSSFDNSFKDAFKAFPKLVTSIALIKARTVRDIGPSYRL